MGVTKQKWKKGKILKKKKRGSIGLPQVGILGMARGVGCQSKASIAQLAGSWRAEKGTVL